MPGSDRQVRRRVRIGHHRKANTLQCEEPMYFNEYTHYDRQCDGSLYDPEDVGVIDRSPALVVLVVVLG